MNKQQTPIIDQISEAVRDVPGWSPVDELYTLFTLAYLTAGLEGDIVEIGSWCGRSTVALGLAAKLVGNTRVHCIDLFPERHNWRRDAQGNYEMEVRVGERRFVAYNETSVWREPFERDIAPIYDRHTSIRSVFDQTVADNDLREVVVPHRGTSSTFLETLESNFRCRLVFIDGDHGYNAVCQDIKSVAPLLVEGGWTCFDDAFSVYDGVDRAIKELVISNGKYELCQQMTRKSFAARKKRTRAGRTDRTT